MRRSAATVWERSPPASWNRSVGPLGSSRSTVATIAFVPGRSKSLESTFQPSGRMPREAARVRL